jgi:hypothetical protein
VVVESQTAGLAFGGAYTPAAVATTEEYDGSAWTAGGSLNTARNISRFRNSNSRFSIWWRSNNNNHQLVQHRRI